MFLNCKSIRTSLIALLMIYPVLSFALFEDKKEKVYIVADSTIYNYKTGVRIYEGNVKVDQGTTHLTADRLITKNNTAQRIQEAIAYGDKTLAHYWTLPKPNEPEIHARAYIIKFYPIESNVIMEKNVNVVQGENNFSGELILYNHRDQTITVPASKNARAVLVYTPEP